MVLFYVSSKKTEVPDVRYSVFLTTNILRQNEKNMNLPQQLAYFVFSQISVDIDTVFLHIVKVIIQKVFLKKFLTVVIFIIVLLETHGALNWAQLTFGSLFRNETFSLHFCHLPFRDKTIFGSTY